MYEAVVKGNNGLYSVNCVCIACSSKYITVLGSHQVCNEKILLQFFTQGIPFQCEAKKPKVDFT